MTFTEFLLTIFTSPVLWGMVVAAGALYLVGRFLFTRINLSEISPEGLAAQKQLQSLSTGKLQDDDQTLVVKPQTPGGTQHHNQLDSLGEPRKTH